MGVATGIAVAAGAAGVASSVAGGIAKNKAAKRAQRAAEQGREYIFETKVPELVDKYINFKELELQGELTPEMEEALQQTETELRNISVDPRLKDTQFEALDSLIQRGKEGLTIEDRTALEQISQEASRRLRSERASILQNLRQRGVQGSGLELASRMQSAGDTADRQAQEGFNQAALSRRQALEAMTAAGTEAGRQRTQDFGEQQTVASAQDAINQFNVSNQQDVQRRNIDRSNVAQEKNLGEKQRIADANVGLQNKENLYNYEESDRRRQQQYQNELGRAQALAGQEARIGQAAQSRGAAQADMFGGIGQSLLGVGTTLATQGLQAPQLGSGDKTSVKVPNPFDYDPKAQG